MDKPGRKNRSLRALALCLAALAAAHVFPAGAEASDAVGGILISSPSVAVSGEYRRKYASDLFSSAFRGDPDSMYRLGIMYRDGAGLPRNSENAIELLKRSAGGEMTAPRARSGFYTSTEARPRPTMTPRLPSSEAPPGAAPQTLSTFSGPSTSRGSP